MKFVKNNFEYTYEIKKSKFIAYLLPYDNFLNTMHQLKNKHPKARHFVYAYRYINNFEQIVQNCSDDGEPKGTSGKPTLNVLAGNNFINSAIITVRYFGGIKLGTGGLVKAYGQAANLVIDNSVSYDFVKLIKTTLLVPYSILSKIEYYIAQYHINILSKKFDTKVLLNLEASKEQFETLEQYLPIGLNLQYE